MNSPMNLLSVVGDFNNDGFMDFPTYRRNGVIAWFENPGRQAGDWEMCIVDECDDLEYGGCAYDLTGYGLGVVGKPLHGSEKWHIHKLMEKGECFSV